MWRLVPALHFCCRRYRWDEAQWCIRCTPLSQGESAILVMADVDAQERVRLGIERQFIVSVHVYYELVDVKLALAEDDECIVDEQDNKDVFLLCDLLEQAFVHVAPFFYECVSVVSVEVSTRVRQPI
jgi:hypothetical protein